MGGEGRGEDREAVLREGGRRRFSLTGSRDEGDEPLCGEVGPVDEGLLGEAVVVEVVGGGAQVAAKVHHAALDQEPQGIKELEGLWNGEGQMVISRIIVDRLKGEARETPVTGSGAAVEGKGGAALPSSSCRSPNHPEPESVPTFGEGEWIVAQMVMPVLTKLFTNCMTSSAVNESSPLVGSSR